jgi:hypothetical protein
VIVVLGAPHSGVTQVAHAIRAAARTARERDPSAWATGQGELADRRVAVEDINDKLMASLGWSREDIPTRPAEVYPARPTVVADIRRLLSSVPDRRHPLVLDDPALSITLPWWQEALGPHKCAVVCIASPISVARAWNEQMGTSIEAGIALWGAYHRHLTRALRNARVILVEAGTLKTRTDDIVTGLVDGLHGAGLASAVLSSDVRGLGSIAVANPQIDRPDWVTERYVKMVSEWLPEPVKAYERWSAAVPDATPWELAVLEAQGRARRTEIRLSSQDIDPWRHARARITYLEHELQAAMVRNRELEQAVAQANASAAAARAAQAAQAAKAAAAAQAAEAAEAARRAEQTVVEQRMAAQGKARGVRGAVVGARMRLVGRGLANPLFDGRWYLAHYPDVRRWRIAPYRHYRRHGVLEGRNPNAYFDTLWYLQRYPDVARLKMDPLDHYLRHGAAEGRDPSPRFSTTSYLKSNPDVRASGMNPLLHYMRHGSREKREQSSAK